MKELDVDDTIRRNLKAVRRDGVDQIYMAQHTD